MHSWALLLQRFGKKKYRLRVAGDCVFMRWLRPIGECSDSECQEYLVRLGKAIRRTVAPQVWALLTMPEPCENPEYQAYVQSVREAFISEYGLAAVAARHGVPFYIAAPTTTIDTACPDGLGIPIEFRLADEVGGFGGLRWSPPDIGAYNPAFDVTPGELIAAIITEAGVLRPPYVSSIGAVTRER